jgi:hypothetical protein
MVGKVRQNEGDPTKEEENERPSYRGSATPMGRFRSLTKRLLKVSKGELSEEQKRHEMGRRSHQKRNGEEGFPCQIQPIVATLFLQTPKREVI